MLGYIKRLSDNDDSTSFANQLRRNRSALFRNALFELEKPVRILDVGGTESFWEKLGLADQEDLEIVLLNLQIEPSKRSNFTAFQGDARHMPQFADKSFDFVLSNSVIEHVGDNQDKLSMAKEIRRIAKRYFIQTPNYWFPLEPHFLFPFFHFLPFNFQVALVQRFNLGWVRREPTRIAAEATVRSVKLLTKKELAQLFPEATIHHERFWGCTKSFVALSWPKILTSKQA